jgi:D-3-phosphoglycerate dehydrogenase
MARVHMGPLVRALVVEEPDPSLDGPLIEAGIDLHRVVGAPDEDQLIRLLRAHDAQVLFKRSRAQVTRRVIESVPGLLAVQLCCIGDDSVDNQACADHGVLVFNDPVSNGRSVVELAIAHLIALSRRLYETDAACRAGAWEKTSVGRFEVKGKVIGVLGLGNIGRQVARAAEAMGMVVCFFDTRYAATEVGIEFGWDECNDMASLFRRSDFISVHLSARDAGGRSNEGVITREMLDQLGRDRPDNSPRIYLNLSRGLLHRPGDLIDAIAADTVRRAAVDVYPDEPRGGEQWRNPYVDEPRVAVTPHIGASTQEAQPRIARRVAQTMLRFSRYGSVRDMVFSPKVKLGLVEDGAEGRVLLCVAHSTARGTKRAIDDAIYNAGASNLSSVHKDFEDLGMAYDLAAIDRPLSEGEIHDLVAAAAEITGDAQAIRSVRQIAL